MSEISDREIIALMGGNPDSANREGWPSSETLDRLKHIYGVMQQRPATV